MQVGHKIVMYAWIVCLRHCRNATHILIIHFISLSCSGGHGTYRLSYSSYYFFNEELRVKLNQRLVTFLKRLDVKIPNIDKQCVIINDHHSNTSSCATVGTVDIAASSMNVHTKPLKKEHQSFDTDSPNLKILNKIAVVKEVLSEDSAILENREESWMCFFTISKVILPRGPFSNLGEALPPGTLVGVNATLIDERKRIKVFCQLIICDIKMSLLAKSFQNHVKLLVHCSFLPLAFGVREEEGRDPRK